jgi:hypothetical protein
VFGDPFYRDAKERKGNEQKKGKEKVMSRGRGKRKAPGRG